MGGEAERGKQVGILCNYNGYIYQWANSAVDFNNKRGRWPLGRPTCLARPCVQGGKWIFVTVSGQCHAVTGADHLRSNVPSYTRAGVVHSLVSTRKGGTECYMRNTDRSAHTPLHVK